MLELLFAILEMLFEVFFEAVFEFAAESVGALIWRLLDAVLDTSEFTNPVLATLAYLLLGGIAGGLSLVLLPHPLVHRSQVPGLSVFLSPLLAGLGMSLVGSTLRQRNKKPLQIESFGYGFAFAFGMALVRFLFAK
jgi:hypothetical protein